jgi:hypothetical protein
MVTENIPRPPDDEDEEEQEEDDYKTYFVENRVTREHRIVRAYSAQEACENVGWLIGDCYIKEREVRIVQEYKSQAGNV